MDENKKRISNQSFAGNIKFLREKMEWTQYKLANTIESSWRIDCLVRRWENGSPITKVYIDKIEDVFRLPHGALYDPDLPQKYEQYRLLYDALYEKPLSFSSGKEFLKEWNSITDYARKHPDEGVSVTREFISTKDLPDKREIFLQFIKALGYRDYDIHSPEFDDLFEGTKAYISRKNKKNRPR